MKKLIIFLMTTAFILAVTGCYAPKDTTVEDNTAATESSAAGYRQISSDEAAEMMNSESGYIILDVRTQEEYESGHIPGAICIPNESIGTSDIPGLPDKNQLILVYCRSGRRSKEAAQKLADMGYTNITEFGGIIDWNGETVTE